MTKSKKADPNKLTPAENKFCVVYHAVNNGVTAYRKAYPKAKKWKDTSVHQEVNKLLKKPKISLRLKKLGEEYAKAAGLTPEDILNQLNENRELSIIMGQMGPATKATELHGKHLGMFGDRLKIDPITLKIDAPMIKKKGK